MALYGLGSNQPIIIPDQVSPFLSIVKDKTTDRARLKKIEAEVNSIQHKLNVIRYQAGLIQTLSENDYGEFIYREQNSGKLSYADYQDRCLFTMSNKHEYALFLTLFIETLSAGAFSLFDICAHLITDIFDLPLPRSTSGGNRTIDISYKQVLQESKLSQDFSGLYNFLYRYRATSQNGNASPDQVPWIDPLEAIRHKITHKPITDIVNWKGDVSVYGTEETAEFFIHNNFFRNQPNGDNLKSFAEKCFDGIEEFVDELFQKLIVEVDNNGFVPI
jgi:hypothetical protein